MLQLDQIIRRSRKSADDLPQGKICMHPFIRFMADSIHDHLLGPGFQKYLPDLLLPQQLLLDSFTYRRGHVSLAFRNHARRKRKLPPHKINRLIRMKKHLNSNIIGHITNERSDQRPG